MEPILKNKPATFGDIIDSRLEPIIQRAKTRNARNINKNRLTLKKVINLYSKTKVNAPEIKERKDWLTRFSRQLESKDAELNDNLEAVFMSVGRLKTTNSRLQTTNSRLQTTNSRLQTADNRNQKIELLAPSRLEVAGSDASALANRAKPKVDNRVPILWCVLALAIERSLAAFVYKRLDSKTSFSEFSRSTKVR